MSAVKQIDRAPGVAEGRSSGSGFERLAFAVATSDDKALDLEGQCLKVFEKLERILGQVGSDKASLLSATVYLSDLSTKPEFDIAWRTWVGNDPAGWPQRVCIGAVLSAGTKVEISVIAARETRR